MTRFGFNRMTRLGQTTLFHRRCSHIRAQVNRFCFVFVVALFSVHFGCCVGLRLPLRRLGTHALYSEHHFFHTRPARVARGDRVVDRVFVSRVFKDTNPVNKRCEKRPDDEPPPDRGADAGGPYGPQQGQRELPGIKEVRYRWPLYTSDAADE